MSGRSGDRIVVAIDGPAGAGKSTVAKRVASRLGLDRLDTGAMYRALTWVALERGVDPSDADELARLARRIDLDFEGSGIMVDGRRREREIRAPRVSAAVSAVAAHPAVRKEMVARQRRFARRGAVVIEGRDIGSVVAPDAELKVFLTASAVERARRRRADLVAAGHPISLRRLTTEIVARDSRDNRTTPLRPARGAVVVDSTGKTLSEVVTEIVNLARGRRDHATAGSGDRGRAPAAGPGDRGRRALARTAAKPARRRGEAGKETARKRREGRRRS